MRKTVVISALGLILAAGGVAWQVPEALGSKGKVGNYQNFQENRLERLTRKLDLTADQQAKLRAIFDEQQAKMKVIREEAHRKVLAVLTPEQEAKYENRSGKKQKSP